MSKPFTVKVLIATSFLFSGLCLFPGEQAMATTPITGTTAFDNNFSATGNLLGQTATTGTIFDAGNPTTSNIGSLASGWDFTATALGGNVSMACVALGASSGGINDYCIRMNSNTIGVTITSAGVKSNDGSAFALQSVYFKANITTGGPATITITGYRNGSPVSGATSTISGINTATWTLFNVSTTSGFQDVDEFRFTQSGTSATMSYVAVDQITIGSIPLPVTLTDFKAHVQGKDVLLNWITASEQKTSYFDIQKSTDGEVFESIGKHVASGNSNTPHSYQFTDKNSNSNTGALLYRLKMVDLNGSFIYSDVVKADMQGEAGFSLQAAPNPFSSICKIKLVAPVAGQGTLTLYNAGGQSVLKQSVTFQNGINDISITGSEQLTKGTYYVDLVVGRQKQTLRLVKL